MSSQLGFTAYYSRKTVKWFGIGVVVYLVLYFVWMVTEPMRRREPLPPPIEVRFEISPTLNFPKQDSNLKFSYRLETATGSLPAEFSDRGVVFKNPNRREGFFTYTGGLKKARRFGFKNKPIPVDPPVYQWRHSGKLPGMFELNMITGEFDLVNNWKGERSLLLSTKKITPNTAFKYVQSALKKGGAWNDNLKEGDHSLIYFKAVNGQLVKIPYIYDADVVQVNFRRKKINKLSVVHADPERPPIWGLTTRGGQVLELHYRYWPVGSESSEYPIITVRDAWQILKAGKAYIARLGDNVPGDEVVIRYFKMAYYISNDYQPFTEPVYVIKGDKEFMALVPAINRSGK